MYRGYGLANYGYGMGQAPGAVVGTTTGAPPLPGSTTTTLSPNPNLGGLTAPGPEVWGSDPVAVTLQRIGGSIVGAPYGQEEAFRAVAIQAIYQAGQIVPGNPDASENACWTCAYVYTYYAIVQLLAQNATVVNNQLIGGPVGWPAGSIMASLSGQVGSAIGVGGLTHAMYDMLRASTYAMSYYAGCLINKQKGLNCAGTGRPIGKYVSVNPQTEFTRLPGASAAPTAHAAAAPASSNTTLILGGLAIAGAAAYLVLG